VLDLIRCLQIVCQNQDDYLQDVFAEVSVIDGRAG
jgi:hypothetical protein